MVASEQALGTFIIINDLPTIQEQAPDMNFDFATLPATENPGDLMLTTNVGEVWGVAEATKNSEAAIAFIDFIGAPERLAASAEANFGLPYTPSDDVGVPSEMAGIEDLYREGRVLMLQTAFWPGAEIKQTTIAECQNLLTGAQDVDGAVKAIIASFDGK